MLAPTRNGHAPWWLAAGASVAVHAFVLVAGTRWFASCGPRGIADRHDVDEPARKAEIVVIRLRHARSENTETFDGLDTAGRASHEMAQTDAFPPPHDVPRGNTVGEWTETRPGDSSIPMAPGAAVPGIAATRVGRSSAAKLPLAPLDPEWLERERAELRARMPAGAPTHLSIFGSRPAAGRSFVFLIDRSKSMGGAGHCALDAAGREITSALSRLEPVHRFTVIAYHHEPAFLDGNRLLAADEGNRRRVAPFLSGLAAFGATDHAMGLSTALGMKADVVFWLKNGGDPRLNGSQTAVIGRDAAERRTTIHCVQFGWGEPPAAPEFLQQVAARCDGSYLYVDLSQRERQP